MHGSSDSIAPGGSLPGLRHPATPPEGRFGQVSETASKTSEIQKGRRFNGFADVWGSSEIQ
jgi:hypothetical protein